MDYMHTTMLEALRGHWPLIEPGTPPAEAQRVAADLDYQQHRESGRAAARGAGPAAVFAERSRSSKSHDKAIGMYRCALCGDWHFSNEL